MNEDERAQIREQLTELADEIDQWAASLHSRLRTLASEISDDEGSR